MLRLICDNDIGSFKQATKNSFDFVTSIEIVSTWESLTDTCRITIPKKLYVKSSVNGFQSDVITNGINQLWKRLDPVVLRLGYAYTQGTSQVNTLNTIFSGYLTRIQPTRPIVFEAEDSMVWMKLTSVTNYAKKGTTTMDVVLREIITPAIQSKYGFTIKADAIQLVNFKLIGTVTIAEVLDYFRKLLNVSAYFQSNVLHVGFAYKLGTTQAQPPVASFDNNINIIENNLDFMRSDDVLISVHAINFNKDNTKDTPVIVGDAFGEIRTVYTFDKTPSDVKDIALQYLNKFKFHGFRGSFLTFLQPTVKHGDSIILKDNLIPDGNGTYLIKKVVTTFGTEGGRQQIFLDQKIG